MLWINEIFYSLQGEGVRAGTPNVFVRLAGCNLTCRTETHGFDCDTEFVSGRGWNIDAVIAEATRLSGGRSHVGMIFTGGEPALQLTNTDVAKAKAAGFFTAIETNGTVDVSALALDWITVSPKVAEHAVRQLQADEVKYVRHHGQGIPKPRVNAPHRLLSPAYGPDGALPRALAWCINLCLENPSWRLSVQQHKDWRVR
jgi:7-carboxy-7-deazaguanine synthase